MQKTWADAYCWCINEIITHVAHLASFVPFQEDSLRLGDDTTLHHLSGLIHLWFSWCIKQQWILPPFMSPGLLSLAHSNVYTCCMQETTGALIIGKTLPLPHGRGWNRSCQKRQFKLIRKTKLQEVLWGSNKVQKPKSISVLCKVPGRGLHLMCNLHFRVWWPF